MFQNLTIDQNHNTVYNLKKMFITYMVNTRELAKRITAHTNMCLNKKL